MQQIKSILSFTSQGHSFHWRPSHFRINQIKEIDMWCAPGAHLLGPSIFGVNASDSLGGGTDLWGRHLKVRLVAIDLGFQQPKVIGDAEACLRRLRKALLATNPYWAKPLPYDCDPKGQPWGTSGDLVGTILRSEKGPPVITLISPGDHKFPNEAPALIVKFFQEYKK